MARPVVLSAVRTPVGRYGGGLSGERPDDLAAAVIAAAVERAGVPGEAIEDVYFGCRQPGGRGQPQRRAHGRSARRAAGVGRRGDAEPALRVGPLRGRVGLSCGRGRRRRPVRRGRRRIDVARSARDGEARAARSRAATRRSGTRRSAGASPIRAWRRCSRSSRWARRARTSPSATASRARSRTRSRCSRSSAGRRRTEGRFETSSSPVGEAVRDEHPRPDTSAEKLAALKPAFREGGTVTAGNSSGLNDGAAALVIASEERARELGAEPLAAFVGSAVAGVDPRVMGIGPVPAVSKLLERDGVGVEELDLVELNEAFASQSARGDPRARPRPGSA